MGAPWSVQEKLKLEKLYADKSNFELSLIFKRPAKSIGWQAWKLGLLKSESQRLQELQQESGVKHCKKGERAIHSGVISQTGNVTIHRMI